MCNVGTNLTPTESTVLFEWEGSENTDNYELMLTDVSTSTTDSHQTTETKIPIVLRRGIAYKWYVISRSNSIADTAHSATRKFFNAAAAPQTYAPFPAEIVSPAMADIVSASAGEITLTWSGSDVDNDIEGYDVYFDIAEDPVIFQSDISDTVLNKVPVMPNTIYYWKVVTTDSSGNSSDSGVIQFKVK